MPKFSIKGHCLQNIFYLLGIITFGTIVYLNSFDGPFVYDDINYIGQNDPHVHMTQLSWDQLKEAAIKGKPRIRPLPNISFALNHYFGNGHVFGYHFINLMIHLLTGIFIFIFLHSTLRVDASNPRMSVFRSDTAPYPNYGYSFIAFAATLIWLVHPVQSQAVTYIVQRMTSMAAMFYVLALVLYIKGRNAQRSIVPTPQKAILYFAGCFFSGICAVASKQNAGMLPVFIILYEFFFFQDLKINHMKPLLWLILLTFVFAAIALHYLGHNPINRILSSYNIRDFDMTQRLLTEPRVVIYYLSLMFFPHPSRLNLDHAYPISQTFTDTMTTLICISAIIAFICIAAYLTNKERLLAFCIIWFAGNLLIESTVIGIEIIYEHRTYLPSIMSYLMVMIVLLRIIQKKWAVACLIGCIIIVLSVWTIQRNAVWQNEIVFWQDCIKKTPNKPRPYLNLAYALQTNKNYEEALTNYYKAFSIAPRRHLSSAYYNMGKAYIGLKKYYEAIDCYYKALKGKPKNTEEILFALSIVFKSIDELDSAIASCQDILKKNPSNIRAKKQLSKLQAIKKRFPDPLERVQRRIKQNPQNPALYFRLGNLLEKEKQYDKAINTYEKVLSEIADPYQKLYIIALNQLAKVKALNNELDAAIGLYKESVQLTPDNAIIYYNIASLYSLKKQTEQAFEWLQKAMDNGYNNQLQIFTDPNLQSFRDSKDFLPFKTKNNINSTN